MSQNPQVAREKPEGDFKYVLFAAPRMGSGWPYTYQFYQGRVQSVDLEIPSWLPYIDVREVAPVVANAHPRWPMPLKNQSGFVPGARVAAMFTNSDVVRRVLFKKGWVDVSERWHKAEAAHREALANPTPDPPSAFQAVTEIATVALRRGRRAVTGA